MNLPPKLPVYGIKADGKITSIGSQDLKEIEAMALGLVAKGRKVEIFDRTTGRFIKRLS